MVVDEKNTGHPNETAAKNGMATIIGNTPSKDENANNPPPSEDDVSDDSIDDIRDAFASPRYAKGELSSPVSSLTIESSVTAKAKAVRRKKVWQLEPIPTTKYIPVPQQDKTR